MPTKTELLREKTTKELRQMARDKELSGYSNRTKIELIKLISNNYLKSEIKSWPDLGLNEIKPVEKTEEQEEVREPEDFRVQLKNVEVDRSFEPSKDIVFVILVLCSAIVFGVAILFLYFGL